MEEVPVIIGVKPYKITQMVNRQIIEQHAEEAAFQWFLRDLAVKRPDYQLSDLLELDEKVDANLDGLWIGGETAWKISLSLVYEDDEYLFPLTYLALKHQDQQKMKAVLSALNDINQSAMISALGWLDFDEISDFIQQLLTSGHAQWQEVGLAALSVHRHIPTKEALKLVNSPNHGVRARLYRLMGEVKLVEYLPLLHSIKESEAEDCHFWRIWALALMGERQTVLPELQAMIKNNTNYQISALQLYLRLCDRENQVHLLTYFQNKLATYPQALHCAGIIGISDNIPWIIEQMKVPELAKLAGEAFSMITGVDLDYEDLILDEDSSDKEEDDWEQEVSDPYLDDLPIPDATLVNDWWQTHQTQFLPKMRYLAGYPISIENLYQVLSVGFQRQRQAAAIELALLQPQNPLFEIREKAKVQVSQLPQTS